ncbi:hypothetical protein L596_012934 [Steinernema carpocapsae]|uniref:Uncharacterized protein n=1 Tax=Steinernema carpocapsae TaxID=34508 RepID=A0A4U5NYQ9_STECR|nr:hypothetical protein L596_012934 [Steinernema carpocapsae]
MECDCLPPPPLFDVPPPIDPSAIWELFAEDEPVSALHKLQSQSCDYNPLLRLVTDASFPSSALSLFAFGAIFVLLLTASALGVVLRCRRSASTPKKSASTEGPRTRGVGGASEWSYNSMKLPNAVSAIQMYAESQGSLGGVRCLPPLPNVAPNARFPSAASATLRIHSDGSYSTASRHYEEISGNFHVLDDCETLFEDISGAEDSYYAAGNPCRRPPPSCRPPPPPPVDATSPISSLSLDGSSSTIDRELAKIQGSPSPRRSDDGVPGRESGYGTGPSRLWHNSPRVSQKVYRNRGVPLTVFAQQNPNHSSMTYV